MSPFAALGLDGDADERAIKRAYAQRLRSVRPDEDPQGFQALHAAYRAALAMLRGQAGAVVAEEEHPEGRPEPGGADAATDHPPGGEGTVDPADGEAGFRLDLDEFLAELLRAIGDDVDISAWLARATGHWPLAVTPLVAPHVVMSLSEAKPLVSPDRLAVIIKAFGLDDVRSNADPLALEHLRRDSAHRWTRHEAVQRGRRLLRLENGRELRKLMRAHGYPAILTRTIAGMMLSRRAALWAAILRWLPLTTAPVMGLLRILGDGAPDALSPPVDAAALARWQASERIRSKVGRWPYLLVPAFLVIVAGVLQQPRKAEFIGTPDADITDATLLIGLHPADADLYVRRGRAKDRAGLIDAGLADAETALVLRPNNAEALTLRASLYEQTNRLDLALADARRATELEPSGARSWYLLGLCQDDKGQYGPALKSYDEAIRIDAEVPAYWNNRGTTHLHRHEDEAAAADYTQAIRLNPEVSMFFVNRGRALERQGKVDAALADYDAALNLVPGNIDARMRRDVVRAGLAGRLPSPAAGNGLTRPGLPPVLGRGDDAGPPHLK